MSGLSFLVPDVLLLRVCAVASCGFAVVFNYYHPVGQPLWLPIGWNVFYIVVNLVWIGYLLQNQRFFLSSGEADLYKYFFKQGDDKYLLSTQDFKKFLKLSTSRGLAYVAEERTQVIRRGEIATHLLMTVSGEVEIDMGGGFVQRCDHPGFFDLGAYVSKEPAPISVTLLPGCRYLVWERDTFSAAMKSDLAVARGLGRVVADEMARLLTNMEDRYVEDVGARKLALSDGLRPLPDRRCRIESILPTEGYTPVVSGPLWDLDDNGAWTRRTYSMAQNGSLLYWCTTHQENIVRWIPPDLMTAAIKKGPGKLGTFDYVFLVWHSEEYVGLGQPQVFAAESFADREMWMEALSRSGRDFECLWREHAAKKLAREEPQNKPAVLQGHQHPLPHS